MAQNKSRTKEQMRPFYDALMKAPGTEMDFRNCNYAAWALAYQCYKHSVESIADITEEMALAALESQRERICTETGGEIDDPAQAVILAKRVAAVNHLVGTSITMAQAGFEKEIDVDCPYCGSPAVFTDSAEIYNGKSYGMIYLCRPCRAFVGVHMGTNIPKGPLANESLRNARKRAHAAFDRIWQEGIMSRNEAYRQAADALMIENLHIGGLDEDGCAAIIEYASKLFKKNK